MSERALVLTTVVGFSVIDFSGDGNETQLNQSHLAHVIFIIRHDKYKPMRKFDESCTMKNH